MKVKLFAKKRKDKKFKVIINEIFQHGREEQNYDQI